MSYPYHGDILADAAKRMHEFSEPDRHGWRSMESAPEYPVEVLCFVEGLGQSRRAVCWGERGGEWFTYPSFFKVKPKAWQPLPPPPESS